MIFEELDNIKQDLWEYLASTNKKIVMYGTGNGADKIIDVLESKKIPLYGIFASDDFARERIFRGHNVRKYRDFCDECDDFIVIVSFATQRDEVLENIYKIATERELYAPDVPVFGSGLFDMKYFSLHREELYSVYNKLVDDISRNTFVSTIAFKLTGKIRYLKECEVPENEVTELIKSNITCLNYVDIGAYTGDTVEKYTLTFGKDMILYAFEPDKKNYEKMLKRFYDKEINCRCFNYAAWNKTEMLKFYSNSGRAGSADKNKRNNKYIELQAVKVDEYIDSKIGFIKIDAEGSDANVIEGLSSTIAKYTPCIKVAAYHRNEDYYNIPEVIDKINNNYKLYMRHLKYVPGWDTDFIFKFITD